MSGVFGKADESVHTCNCIGPQHGQPLCPCQMKGVKQREGRWIKPEQDLGPVTPELPVTAGTRGCVCPPGSEASCRGTFCPRKPIFLGHW